MSGTERDSQPDRAQEIAGREGRVRLHKLLALRGVCSRRRGEELIRAGKVRVNGKVVREVGTTVDPERDRVEVNGQFLPPPPEFVYFLLNKPRNVLTTLRDDRGRPTIRDLLPQGLPRVFPVGRLDWDSEGLLLLTNDGELAFRLTHPRYEILKTYRVTVERPIEDKELERLRSGVVLDDGPTGPAKVRHLGEREFLIGIAEGRNRQVRRMCAAVGHRVVRLVRVAEGPVRLGELASGALRPLTEAEVSALRREVGLDPIR